MSTTLKIDTRFLGDTRVGQVVNDAGLNAEETIQEAIDYGYVVGKKEAFNTHIEGVMKAMFTGIEEDANGRKFDEVISLQAYTTGALDDPTDNITKDKIGAVVRARMLKGIKLDDSAFTFIIEGSTGTLRVTVITTGEKEGEIVLGEDVKLNGLELEMKPGDKIAYEVPESGAKGEIAAEFVTSESTRITLGGAALSALAADPANNGRDIVFTIRIGSKKVVKSAKMVIG